MDKHEAQEIARQKLEELERDGFASLRQRIDQVTTEDFTTDRGTTYNLECQIFWDSQPNGAIRVVTSIDDGGWRSFFPLSVSTIVEPME